METTELEVPRSTMPPARVLYIVARDRLDVYAALLDAFVESPRLSIMLDRRDDAHGIEEPRGDRRSLLVDEMLRTRGWVRMRIEPDGRAILIDEVSS